MSVEADSNQNTIETKNNVPNISNDFIADLKEFIDLGELIHIANDEMKLLKERKKELELKLSEFMFDQNINAFKTPNGKITVHQTKSVKPLNKDNLKGIISKKYLIHLQ